MALGVREQEPEEKEELSLWQLVEEELVHPPPCRQGLQVAGTKVLAPNVSWKVLVASVVASSFGLLS